MLILEAASHLRQLCPHLLRIDMVSAKPPLVVMGNRGSDRYETLH